MIEKPIDGPDIAAFFQVQKLLMGQLETGQKKPRTVYFDPGSQEEAEALSALATFLRRDEPLPGGIRLMLADLFDPSPNERTNRSLTFSRKLGKPADSFQRRKIAETVFIYLMGHDIPNHAGQDFRRSIEEVIPPLAAMFAMEPDPLKKLWYKERHNVAATYGLPHLFSDHPLSDKIAEKSNKHNLPFSDVTHNPGDPPDS